MKRYQLIIAGQRIFAYILRCLRILIREEFRRIEIIINNRKKGVELLALRYSGFKHRKHGRVFPGKGWFP